MNLDHIQMLLRRGETLVIPSQGLVRVLDSTGRAEISDLTPTDVVHFLEQRAKNSLKRNNPGA